MAGHTAFLRSFTEQNPALYRYLDESMMPLNLGVAFAKEILDLCGGTISAASTQGKGSTFTVRLPLAVDTAQAALPPADRVADSIEGVRILIAEDNEINMEIAHYMLETRGAIITEAHNGREAVDLFAAAAPNSYDVILMDIMMPEMDGLEATRAIRAMSRPDAKTVPFFAMTANAFVEASTRALPPA